MFDIPVITLMQTYLLTHSHTPNLEMLSHLKNPEILLNLMLQNQMNDVDEIAYVSIGFDRHNALI